MARDQICVLSPILSPKRTTVEWNFFSGAMPCSILYPLDKLSHGCSWPSAVGFIIIQCAGRSPGDSRCFHCMIGPGNMIEKTDSQYRTNEAVGILKSEFSGMWINFALLSCELVRSGQVVWKLSSYVCQRSYIQPLRVSYVTPSRLASVEVLSNSMYRVINSAPSPLTLSSHSPVAELYSVSASVNVAEGWCEKYTRRPFRSCKPSMIVFATSTPLADTVLF